MSIINLMSPTTFTAAVLVTDEVQALNGSLDSVPQLSKSGAETASIALEIQSTLGGLLLPRMTTAQRLLLTATNGMMVYDTTINAIYAYENGAWDSGGISSISQGSNIILTPNPITLTGTVALNPVLTGITSISTAEPILTGGFTDHVNALSSSLTSYQILISDSVVIPNTTTNAITLTLPTAVQGTTIKVIDGFGNASSKNITVNSSGTINGGSSVTISSNYGEKNFVYNGTQWNAY